MKQIILLVLTIIFFSSCSGSLVQSYSEYESINQDIDYRPKTFEDAWCWVSENIVYKNDYFFGYKQSPEETYRLRTGDCEDFAILLAYFGYTLNNNVTVVKGCSSDGEMHVICRYSDSLIEPQIFFRLVSDFNIMDEYSYFEAMETIFIRTSNFIK